jgi:hypothetical protein
VTERKEQSVADVKAVFYLPVQDNDGRDLSSEIQDLLANLWTQWGCWTYHRLVEGVWRMQDGTRSDDLLQWYSMVLPEDEVPRLEELLRDFKGKTLQESIYLEIQRVELRLI